MWAQNEITNSLKISYPIIQAPMAGFTTPELVAAVSNAGGLGSLGAALMSAEQIRDAIHKIRKLTDKPFAVNLFIPEDASPSVALEEIQLINELLEDVRRELNLPTPDVIEPLKLPFAEQLEVIIQEKIPIFSFTFGVLPTQTVKLLKQHDIKVIGTATNVNEAKTLAETGVDFIVAQGYEAGGHRGSHAETNIADALIGSVALIPQIVDQVKIPVIASGGIMDARGIVAAFALGAQAVQMGTAFLTCSEAGTHAQHRAALLKSIDENTQLTRAFTGRYARGIKNRLMKILENYQSQLPGYAIQNAMTRDIRQAAAQQNNAEYMALWSGQAASLCQELPAEKLIIELVKDIEKIIRKLG